MWTMRSGRTTARPTWPTSWWASCLYFCSFCLEDRYDALPDVAVFLHADAPEHIPTIDLLMDSVYAAARGRLPPEAHFVHLAHNYVRHDCPGLDGPCVTPDAFEVAQLWKLIFQTSITPVMSQAN